MADKITVVTDPTEDKKKQEVSVGEEVRSKSISQLLKEEQLERNKPAKEEDKAPIHTPEDDEKAREDQRLAKEAEDAKAKIEADEAYKKRLEEIATKAAQDVIDKQKADEQERLDKIKQEENEAKRKEDLKPKFTGKDAQGNTVPLSYEELHAEDVRVAKE